jgi:hypothetical protein
MRMFDKSITGAWLMNDAAGEARLEGGIYDTSNRDCI